MTDQSSAVLLAFGLLTQAQVAAPVEPPSLELLEYIGDMPVTEEGELLDLMDIETKEPEVPAPVTPTATLPTAEAKTHDTH